MLVYAFLLILLLRPSWGLWGLFSIVAAALILIAGFVGGMDPLTVAVGTLIQGTIFCGLGALIVFLRLRFGRGGRTRQDKEIDAELARMRGDAAARDNQPPQR